MRIESQQMRFSGSKNAGKKNIPRDFVGSKIAGQKNILSTQIMGKTGMLIALKRTPSEGFEHQLQMLKEAIGERRMRLVKFIFTDTPGNFAQVSSAAIGVIRRR